MVELRNQNLPDLIVSFGNLPVELIVLAVFRTNSVTANSTSSVAKAMVDTLKQFQELIYQHFCTKGFLT
tara:strand:+ start:988 stop:1194 length:207 start_codon:yes stop_codon:yes gene_type:complete